MLPNNRIYYLLFLLIIACTSCHDNKYHNQLLLAEEQVTKSADSCSKLLEAIPVEQLNEEDQALHGLISSWLLYRQYAKEIPEEPLERAFDYYRTSKDPLRKAQAYFLHSVISEDQKRGNADVWMEDLYTACLAVEKTEDYLLASQIFQNYGSKLTQLEQFDEARIWVDKFVDAAQQSGHRGEYVQSLIIKANNYLYSEEARVKQQIGTNNGIEVAKHTHFDEAFATIYQALRIAQEHEMQTEKGRIYTQLSIYHSRCQQVDSSLYYSRLSVLLNEQLYLQGKRKQQPQYLTLADAYRKAGMADSAIHYALKTYDMEGTPVRNRRVAAQLLYNIYADLKDDYKQSLEWSRIYNQLTDSLNQTTIASNLDAVKDAAVKEQEKTELRAEKQSTQNWLIWNTIIGLLIIASILCVMIRNRRKYHQHLQDLERELNLKINEITIREKDMKTRISSEEKCQKVLLTGSTREQIEVEASSILFLTSESNYVKVLHLDADGKVQSKMIRQTMNNIESQLNGYPYIIRCHRAFIVNLQHVRQATSSPTGLQLTLDASSLLVPVSKTYLSLVKESLG